MVLVPESRVAYRFNDAAEFQSSYGCAGQKRGEKEVVSRRNDNDVIEFLVDIL